MVNCSSAKVKTAYQKILFRERGMWELLFGGYSFVSFEEDEKF